MKIETLISLGYWLPSLVFLVASAITFLAVRKFGKSALGSIFSYILIGTSIFFVITVFQNLGSDFFRISNQSMDLWWHMMFYMALISFYYGLKFLVGLGTGEPDASQGIKIGREKIWAVVAVVLLAMIFVVPNFFEAGVITYTNSYLGQKGLHHLLAVLLSGMVGSYLLLAKKNFGQIGKAIASPMTVAVWVLSFQHILALLTESWGVVAISSQVVEGVERLFLIITAVSLTYAAWRLRSFTRA